MNLIPYDSFTIQSELSPEVVLIDLFKHTSPKGIWGTVGENYFTGTIAADSFKIYRTIVYRNSFLPMISGVVEQSSDGSKITFQIKPNLFTILFMSIWIGVTILIPTMLLIESINDPELVLSFLGAVPVAIVIFILGWIIMSLSFWFEGKKSKDKIREIFGEIEESINEM